MKLNPLAAVDALLKAAALAASGYEDLVLTDVESSVSVASAPMNVTEIQSIRERNKADYARDPGGFASRVLPGLNAVFDAIKGLV